MLSDTRPVNTEAHKQQTPAPANTRGGAAKDGCVTVTLLSRSLLRNLGPDGPGLGQIAAIEGLILRIFLIDIDSLIIIPFKLALEGKWHLL